MRAKWKGPLFYFFYFQFENSTVFSSKSHIPTFLVGRRINVYNGRSFESFLVRCSWPFKYRFGDFITSKKYGHIIHQKLKHNNKKKTK